MKQPYIISVVNQKGGVGKTTTVHNLASFLGRKHRVLAIDMDPQASLTIGTGLDPDDKKNVVTAINGESLASIIVKRNNFMLLPGSIVLSEFDVSFSSVMGREMMLKKLIKPIEKDYDFILIDCQPTLALSTVNSLVASDKLLIPQQTEFFSMKGLELVLQAIQNIKDNDLNNNLDILGIVLTLCDKRKTLHKDVVEVLKDNFPELVMDTIIRSNVDLASAPSHYSSIFDYAPKSKGAIDYEALGKEFLKRLKKGAK